MGHITPSIQDRGEHARRLPEPKPSAGLASVQTCMLPDNVHGWYSVSGHQSFVFRVLPGEYGVVRKPKRQSNQQYYRAEVGVGKSHQG